jgi:uncharacterized protein
MTMLAALLTVVVANVVSVAEVPSPRPTHWVTDQANILDSASVASLDAIAEGLHTLRGIELAVVTVEDVQGTPKAFATSLFNKWGIGSAQTNNGVLVLLVMGQRRLEVETGTGIEAALPAQWLADMQARDMVPKFKLKQFGPGLVAGVQAIADHLREAPGESTSTAPRGEYRSNGEVVDPTAPSTQSAVGTPATPATEPASRSSTYSPPDEDHHSVPIAFTGLGLIGAGGTAFAIRSRRRLRLCMACTPPRKMIALDEVADDAHLDPGQRTEERVGSVDYEVLVCPGCQASRTLRHNHWFSSFSKCSGCGYKTMTSSSTTRISATYDHGGEVDVQETCANCSYVNRYTKHTAQLVQASTSSDYSSSSSSSSDSSSGSGFSGGSSSGGGAGSSW